MLYENLKIQSVRTKNPRKHRKVNKVHIGLSYNEKPVPENFLKINFRMKFQKYTSENESQISKLPVSKNNC